MERAQVSLNDGQVQVALRADNRLTISELRRVIRRQGFSPREAELRVRGTIQVDGHQFDLVLPGSRPSYRIVSPGPIRERLGELAGRRAEITGRISQDTDDVTPSTLEVTAVGEVMVPSLLPPQPLAPPPERSRRLARH